MTGVLLGGQVVGLYLHEHACPQLNTKGRHSEGLSVVFILKSKMK